MGYIQPTDAFYLRLRNWPFALRGGVFRAVVLRLVVLRLRVAMVAPLDYLINARVCGCCAYFGFRAALQGHCNSAFDACPCRRRWQDHFCDFKPVHTLLLRGFWCCDGDQSGHAYDYLLHEFQRTGWYAEEGNE